MCSLSGAALANTRQNGASVRKEMGVPLVSWGFWIKQGWEVGPGQPCVGGSGHAEHSGCCWSFAGHHTFPELANHHGKAAGEITSYWLCLPIFTSILDRIICKT